MEVRVLHVIPYESSRKRMSMIVELPDGRLVLFCKVGKEKWMNDRALTVCCWSFMILNRTIRVLLNRSLVRLERGQKRRSVRWCSVTSR